MDRDEGDDSIWESLPDEVVEKVLFLLSARELLQLRLVCKRWLQLIDSPAFDKACTHRPAFLISGEHCTGERGTTAFVYNTYQHKWYELRVSSLRFRNRVCDGSSIVDLGLWKDGIRVINRVTGSTLRELPLPAPSVLPPRPSGTSIHPWNRKVSLVVQSSSSFTVISAGSLKEPDRRDFNQFHVYDSISNKWEAGGEVPQLQNFSFMHEPYGRGQLVMAACGPFVYHVVIVDRGGPCPGYRLLAFDLKRRMWIVMPGSLPATIHQKKPTTLFVSKSSVVLVLQRDLEEADCMRNGHWAPDVFSWDVTGSPDVQAWSEVSVSRPPTNLEFLPDEDEDYAFPHFRYKILCLGKGDYIMFVCHRAWGSQVLVYDMYTRAWTLTNFGVNDLDWTVSDLSFVQVPVLSDSEPILSR